MADGSYELDLAGMNISIDGRVFPHRPSVFYQALTQYLIPDYGDE